MRMMKIGLNLALLLALGVLMLGAYTRLTDAGLGCPDWPGCYGHMVLPEQSKSLAQAQARYPQQPIESEKAWTEMAHRYLAGSLLVLIVLITLSLLRWKNLSLGYAGILMLLLAFQAALGMWTVTLKLLPPVVMGHLLGGMLIFAVLALMRSQYQVTNLTILGSWRWWVRVGTVLIFLQIALGGWVSSNYAAISCQGFPTCNGLWLPPLNLHQAFDLLQSIGPNYQGGLLDVDARMTIHWVHRMIAGLVYLYWLILGGWMLRVERAIQLRRFIYGLLGFLTLQMLIGMFNVTHDMPLVTAVLHNGVGAIIFGCAVVINGLLSSFYETD